MVGLPEFAVAVVLLDVDDVVVQVFLQAQAEFFDALGDHGRAADQCRAGEAFVDHDLAGAQHAFFFALGIGHTLLRGGLGRGVDRLHHGARGEHEAL
ncbi:hypothetical protein D3C72_2343860 [compost metagenome]